MKLKSLLTFATLTAVTTAMAVVTSQTELCRIEVNSGSKNTIVALPLVEVNGNVEAISVSKFVMTDGLTPEETTIVVMDADGKTELESWDLKEANGVKYWNPIRSVNSESEVSQASDATETQRPRGSAIWLQRNKNDAENPFYLYGQVSNKTVTPTIAKGSSGSPAYTLIGNPKLEDITNINDSTQVAWTAVSGDKIVWGMSDTASAKIKVNEFTYKTVAADSVTQDGWGRYEFEDVKVGDKVVGQTTVWKTVSIGLPAGQGFWYITTSNDSDRSIDWKLD